MKVTLINIDFDYAENYIDMKLRIYNPKKKIGTLLNALMRAREPFFISIRALRERKEKVK